MIKSSLKYLANLLPLTTDKDEAKLCYPLLLETFSKTKEVFEGDLNWKLNVRDQYAHLDVGLIAGVGYKFKKQCILTLCWSRGRAEQASHCGRGEG